MTAISMQSAAIAPRIAGAVRKLKGEPARVLSILALVNFVNYVDRQVLFPLFPAIRAEFSLTHFQLGMLASAFTIVLSIGSLPLGILADRTSRRSVISAGVLCWSAATFLSGLAGSFRALLAARALVGVGEAAYTPAGTAIISSTFSGRVRARVQGVFDVGMFVGGAVGIAIGGILGEMVGWRAAFFVVGIPGLLLGISALRLPPNKAVDVASEDFGIRDLLREPAYRLILISGWFSAFAGYAYISWGPEFVQDYKGFSARDAGIVLGLTVVVAGMLGVLTGATIADRFARWATWARAAVVPIGFMISAPLIYLALHSHGRTAFVGLFGAGTFFLTWYHGPVTATIHDIVPPRAHARAIGLYYLFVNLFSMALAPMLIGFIADRGGLLRALSAAVLAQIAGAGFFVLLIFKLRGSQRQKDTKTRALPKVAYEPGDKVMARLEAPSLQLVLRCQRADQWTTLIFDFDQHSAVYQGEARCADMARRDVEEAVSELYGADAGHVVWEQSLVRRFDPLDG